MNQMIEIENLYKRYKNVEAVKGISFSVSEGSFFAFLGINGAGKSTTINILSSVIAKTSGSVFIGGYDLDKNPDEIKKLIGIVFQNSVLDKQLSVKQNLESRASYYGLSKKDIKKRLNELKNIFDLEEIWNRKYMNLSGGQKRRVDIARALINKPKVLFMDEPTTGLDPQTRQRVWEIIHKLRKETGLTIFLTTHYMEETADCDSVVILDKGVIVAKDTPNNLKKQYAKNKFITYLSQNPGFEKVLEKEKYEYSYHKDSYEIKIDSSKEATRLLMKYPEYFESYEVIKGDMDDVFLAVTGKRLGD